MSTSILAHSTSTIGVTRKRNVSKGMAKVWNAPFVHVEELCTDEWGWEYTVCAKECPCYTVPVLGRHKGAVL